MIKNIASFSVKEKSLRPLPSSGIVCHRGEFHDHQKKHQKAPCRCQTDSGPVGPALPAADRRDNSPAWHNDGPVDVGGACPGTFGSGLCGRSLQIRCDDAVPRWLSSSRCHVSLRRGPFPDGAYWDLSLGKQGRRVAQVIAGLLLEETLCNVLVSLYLGWWFEGGALGPFSSLVLYLTMKEYCIPLSLLCGAVLFLAVNPARKTE